MAKRSKTALTDRHLALGKPATGRVELTDAAAPGLIFRVAASGVKSWIVRYTPLGATRRKALIGIYGTGDRGLSLAQARDEAHEIAKAARQGRDRPAETAETRRAAEAIQRAAKRGDGPPATVGQLLNRYIGDYCKANQRRWQQTQQLFEAHVAPEIGDKALATLRRADVVALLERLRNRKGLAAQVNRVRSQVLAALNWAVEHEYVAGNPAAGIKRYKGVEQPRTRTLNDQELRAIWQAADGLGYPSGALVKLLVLTGQRRDEVRCLPWAEIQEGGAVWRLPGKRNKSKRDHVVPLSSAARSTIDALPKNGKFVLSVAGNKPYAGQRRLKEILDRESGVIDWTLHDIRRTVRSRMAEMGVERGVAQRVLNHARPGLDRVYDQADYRPAVAKALEDWGQRVLRVVGEAGNVVEFSRSA